MTKAEGSEDLATQENVDLHYLRKADYETVHLLATNTSLKQLCEKYVRGEHLKCNVDKTENPRAMGSQTNSFLKMSFTGQKEGHQHVVLPEGQDAFSYSTFCDVTKAFMMKKARELSKFSPKS